MPIYEYHCADCGQSFEKLVRRTADLVECPDCHGAQVEQQYSTFAAKADGGGPMAGFANTPAATRTGGCGGPACQRGMCGSKN